MFSIANRDVLAPPSAAGRLEGHESDEFYTASSRCFLLYHPFLDAGIYSSLMRAREYKY